MTSEAFAGEPLEPSGEVIEIQVSELKRLFNAMDPAPFRERDLDPAAEESVMSVRIRYATEKNPDAWQYDWPAAPLGAASSGQGV